MMGNYLIYLEINAIQMSFAAGCSLALQCSVVHFLSNDMDMDFDEIHVVLKDGPIHSHLHDDNIVWHSR